MIASKSIFHLLKRLWQHIGLHRRWQFLGLLILMVVASFAEIVSIGAVLPFLAVLTSPERVFNHHMAQPLISAFNLVDSKQLLLPLAVGFGVAAIAAGLMRLLLLWASTRLSFSIGADISISIYRRTLYQSYAVHIARNSSQVISGITGKANGIIFSTILPILTIASSGVMLIAILIALFVVNPRVALAGFFSFGLIYGVLIWITRKRKIANGQRIAQESTQVIKSLQEGLGGIRDVLIDGTQEVYCRIYRDADLSLRQAQGDNQFVGQSPRYGMEALGMVIIALLAYDLSTQADGISKAVPVLGALALGAQRLLPLMQQAYAALSSIQGSQASLGDTLDLLEQPLPRHAGQLSVKPLSFRNEISINQLFFRYNSEMPWVLKGLNLTITKGARLGFIGATGGGKSTLLDIVMGLLEPTEGTLAVDGQHITGENCRAWQANIAHVPQTIYLSDSTIEENIAFGVPREEINKLRVREVARQAQIADIIDSWPMRYETLVGERGVRLSGGQRQRIGIARALYKHASLIIFDEATSALDNETEDLVMSTIESLGEGITVLMIAHRLSTLRKCNKIFELVDGKISRSGTYQQIVLDSE